MITQPSIARAVNRRAAAHLDWPRPIVRGRPACAELRGMQGLLVGDEMTLPWPSDKQVERIYYRERIRFVRRYLRKTYGITVSAISTPDGLHLRRTA
jgi:hypothetical protein